MIAVVVRVLNRNYPHHTHPQGSFGSLEGAIVDKEIKLRG
jgi:hypothetical protein